MGFIQLSEFLPISLFFWPQFLSMKLATVNPLDFSNLPTLLQKDVSLDFPLLSMPCPVIDQSTKLVDYSHMALSKFRYSKLGLLTAEL